MSVMQVMKMELAGRMRRHASDLVDTKARLKRDKPHENSFCSSGRLDPDWVFTPKVPQVRAAIFKNKPAYEPPRSGPGAEKTPVPPTATRPTPPSRRRRAEAKAPSSRPAGRLPKVRASTAMPRMLRKQNVNLSPRIDFGFLGQKLVTQQQRPKTTQSWMQGHWQGELEARATTDFSFVKPRSSVPCTPQALSLIHISEPTRPY
eukprot:TRINITY_DN4327_c0_g1_i5.p2 TRINITY_DN4327_c0_g1~~TRINITY_DN4327_c0_g1_i5.p2  ORF type:complete len:204 (-),score=40.03 TRINITY_DN4327_c0_g1_i5:54-665(-)